MRLWLVRHPAVQLPAGICYGATDVAADPVHTAACADRLARLLPETVAAWSSPLGRCRSLADALQAQRPGLRFKSDPRLAEMDFGRWEGQHWDRIGAAAVAAWTEDFAQHRPGGGESVQIFLARVRQALDDTVARACEQGCAQALWITHAGVVKAARWLQAEREPLTRADQWPAASLACGECCVLDLPAAGPLSAE